MAITVLTSNENGANSLIDINANFADLDTTKADLASPTFTGTPSLPTGTTGVTQSASDNSTKLATTAYVDTAISTVSTFSGASVTTAGGTITSDSSVAVAWNGENYDTDSYHDNSTNNSRLTVPSTGKYLVTCTISHTSSAASLSTSLQLKVDNTTIVAASDSTATSNLSTGGHSITTVLSLTANQYVEAILYAKASGLTYTYSATGSAFTITKLK